MKIIRLVLIIVVSVVGVLPFSSFTAASLRQSSSNKPSPKARLELQPCNVGRNLEARCGKYEVFEDRSARTGRRISLNVVVVPATSAHPSADPLFFFSGGPGQGATGAAGAAGFGFLARVRKDRDLVFIDQRGTGHSNPLNCDRFDDPKDLQGYFGELYPLDKIRECREKLEKVANLTPVYNLNR
jgi:hypothetical protein